ncbi:MAG TPA: hypothetical protein VMI33_26535 [Streptosporangiaceae bacterium]|nr:hypothetical protein [Streptosporangiaceae bacterium]
MNETAAGRRGLQASAGRGLHAAAGLGGLLMLAVPALAAPTAALALTGAGTLLVIGSLVTWVSRQVPAGTLATGIAVIQCAAWPPGTLGLAAEGLLILGYVLLLDGPVPIGSATAGRWLRGQVPAGAAGLVGTGAVLAALAAPPAASPWLVLAGLAAAVAAYLIAVPRLPRLPRQPRPPSAHNTPGRRRPAARGPVRRAGPSGDDAS